jgi:hypothetical protein
MVQVAAEVRMRQYSTEYDASHLTWEDFADEAREVLEAALSFCDATTDALPYTGEEGELRCSRLADHRPSHRSVEGAQWVDEYKQGVEG